MALTAVEGTMLPASAYPFPTTGTQAFSDPTYNVMSWRCSYDTDWLSVPETKVVFFFHGSGGTREPQTGTFIDALLADGYVVFQPMNFGAWNEPFYNCPAGAEGSHSPYRYNYGSSFNPNFISHFIKSAWWVQSALEYFLDNFPWTDITLTGHSLGAQAVISWSAGYASEANYNVRGILASGATVGAPGNNNEWTDINRNITIMSQSVALLRHRAILAWGDLDASAPPDYQRRLQEAIPAGKDTYVVSPGAGDHHWDTNPLFFQYFVDWAEQLAEGAMILDRFGNPAVAGAVA